MNNRENNIKLYCCYSLNLRKFLYEIQNDDDFETIIYDFDDGISVSRKIK